MILPIFFIILSLALLGFILEWRRESRAKKAKLKMIQRRLADRETFD